MPTLPARREQRDALPRQWILGIRDVRLELITRSVLRAYVSFLPTTRYGTGDHLWINTTCV
jgi:hypothetical protein